MTAFNFLGSSLRKFVLVNPLNWVMVPSISKPLSNKIASLNSTTHSPLGKNNKMFTANDLNILSLNMWPKTKTNLWFLQFINLEWDTLCHKFICTYAFTTHGISNILTLNYIPENRILLFLTTSLFPTAMSLQPYCLSLQAPKILLSLQNLKVSIHYLSPNDKQKLIFLCDRHIGKFIC